IARDFLRVISCLKAFCLFTHAVPYERNRHVATYCHMAVDEMSNGDHSVSRIAEAKIWNMVAHGARLLAIRARRQHNDGDVSIGCGTFVTVKVDKADRISVAG
ncbi:MAG TPA: hypothetical protein VL136_07105, partial [Candidatus Babeliales bacterium]|nr:hypothetical protein [Candidatus Babeliales bacterium]